MAVPIRAVLRLVRAPNTLTAAADVLAGAALAGADPLGAPALLAAAGSLAIYAGGVAVNDVADLAKDRTLHPRRVLPAGLLSVRTATWVGATLLGLGACSAVPVGGLHLGITVLLTGIVVAYDLLPDRHRLLGPGLMAGCRGLNLLRGATLLAAPPPVIALLAAAAHAWLIFAVTAISTFEDRRARGPAFRLACLLLPLPYLLPAFCGSGPASASGAATLAAGVALGAFVTAPGWSALPPPEAIVRRAVFTLVLFDGLYALAAGRAVTAAVLAALFPLMGLLARAIGQRGS